MVTFAQIGGGLVPLAAQLITVGLVQQLLFEALYRKYSCPCLRASRWPENNAHISTNAETHLLSISISSDRRVGLLCSEFLELYYRVIKEEQSLRQSFLTNGEKPGAMHASGHSRIIFRWQRFAIVLAVFRRLLVAVCGRLAFRRRFAVMLCALRWPFSAVLLQVLIVAVMLLACGRFPRRRRGLSAAKVREESANDIAADNKTIFSSLHPLFLCALRFQQIKMERQWSSC